MQNGSGLLGNSSSSQAALIVPFPNDPNLYYLFVSIGNGTTSAAGPAGITYSIIDMRLDGGLGGLVPGLKNQTLFAPSSERMAAIRHENGRDVWLIGNRNPQAREVVSYLLTGDTTITSTPVVSNVGVNDSDDVIGFIVFSPDGEKAAITHLRNRTISLLDFDRATGIFSNKIVINNAPNITGGLRTIEFSPDGRYLYAASQVIPNTGIIQFDLCSNNQAQINASAFTLVVRDFNTNRKYDQGMLLGPDGKIYIGSNINDGYIARIESPNLQGNAANYVEEAIFLGAGKRTYGFCNFVKEPSVLPRDASGINVAGNTCINDALTFTISNTNDVTSVDWDFGNGNTFTGLTPPPQTYTTAGVYTITAAITRCGMVDNVALDITITSPPTVSTVADVNQCATTFNLRTIDTEVLGTLPATDYQVEYYENQADADNRENSLPDLYTPPSSSQVVYIRVHANDSQGCYAIQTFTLNTQTPITIGTISTLNACISGATVAVDLTQKDTEVLGTQNPTEYTVTYHETELDAQSGTDIPNPTTYDVSASQQIYVRVESVVDSNCFNTGSFALQVSQEPRIANLTVLTFCGNGNAADFNLRDKDTEILGTQNASDFEITYHNSSDDAMNDTNAIANPEAYSAQSSEEIYVRIENATNAACFETGSFNLMISQTPVIASAPLALDNCGTMGVATFNLRENDDEVLGSQTATDVTITYHTSSDDAMNNANAITTPENYTSQQDGEEIFVRIENNTNTVCFATDSFILNVFEIPTAGTVTDLELCDANADVINYDLSFSFPEILGTQDTSQFDISFYSSQADADARTNELELTQETSEAITTVFARIENIGNTACFQTTSFNILKRESPVLTIADNVFICPGETLTVTADTGYDSYEWSTGATTESIDIDTPGEYSVTVTANYNSVNCTTTKTFMVTASVVPQTIAVIVVDFKPGSQNTIKIIAEGGGDFEYSIDGITFQESNVFTNVAPGDYIAFVRDKGQCVTLSEELYVLGYPLFFTPNGDGFNESWQVLHAEREPENRVYIFDRYGKLLTRFTQADAGWDGAYNGKQMPSTDYWFKVERITGQTIKGHFTLKR